MINEEEEGVYFSQFTEKEKYFLMDYCVIVIPSFELHVF